MLEDEIKKMTEELAAAKAAEEKPEAEVPAPEPEAEPEPEPEKKEEEKPVEEPKKEEPEPDANAYQRMRREKAAAEAKAAALEKELADARKKPEAEAPATEEEALPLPPVLDEIVRNHHMTKAEQEFQALEAQFRASTPDYDGVAGQYVNALANSIKIQNPRLSQIEIAQKTKETVLLRAANLMREGYKNPIEEMYHEALELGFKAPAPKSEEKEEAEPKPDMKKLAANRARSTGMAASTGKSEGQLTKAAAANLTNAEWMALSPVEKKRLMSLEA